MNALLAVLMPLDLLFGAFEATVNAVRRALGREETPTPLMRRWARVERWIPRARLRLDPHRDPSPIMPIPPPHSETAAEEREIQQLEE